MIMNTKKRLSVLLLAGLLAVGVPFAASAAEDTVREKETVVSYGLDVLASREEMVMAGLVGNEIGYYLREGEHDFTPENWKVLMDFADARIK
jgi:hypothetical protein